MPYHGDLITGLTNLLYKVAMPQHVNTARNPSAPETNVSKAYPALKNSIHTISFMSFEQVSRKSTPTSVMCCRSKGMRVRATLR